MATLTQHIKQWGRRLLRREPWHTPQVRRKVVHFGNEAYGSWALNPDLLPGGGIIYSFGVGEDISFDLALLSAFDVVVYAFDPTPRSIAWVKKQSLPDRFYLVEYGLADYDGMATFYGPENPNYCSHTVLGKQGPSSQAVEMPVRRLVTLATLLGHDEIDLLKMDIEGAEYTALPDLLSSGPAVRQLLVEFHHRFEAVSIGQTAQAVRLLNEHGYRLFHVSVSGDEYSFVKV